MSVYVCSGMCVFTCSIMNNFIMYKSSYAWSLILMIPAHEKLSQKNCCKFETRL